MTGRNWPWSTGPSPRAWGEQHLRAVRGRELRTIPTRVGRTDRALAATIAITDHPHARGENMSACESLISFAGPSPRAWGEQPHSPQARRLSRTIPTRVGRTEGLSGMSASYSDHPHARGENPSALPLAQEVPGPSPRAWGELGDRLRFSLLKRTIPTRVGRTVVMKPATELRTDHPHARGENFYPDELAIPDDGPSPRAWGERQQHPVNALVVRTIPTRVGRTLAGVANRILCADHPHARGENASVLRRVVRAIGPSPRAWGERRCRAFCNAVNRTIPTRVGRTLRRQKPRRKKSDHPHARGENRYVTGSVAEVSGPSPRAWGEREGGRAVGGVSRTIPTRVGRTHTWGRPMARWTDHPHARGENALGRRRG